MAMISKTSKSPAGANFPTVGGDGKSVSVSPKGGVKVGPTHCTSKRAASNVKTSY